MASLKTHEGAVRLDRGWTYFDVTTVYNLDDWLFRLHCYYEILRNTLGPNLMVADKEKVEELDSILNLMMWAKDLPPGVTIGFQKNEQGQDLPCIMVEDVTRIQD